MVNSTSYALSSLFAPSGDSLATCWVCLTLTVLESILSQYRGDLEECCYAVLRQWLDNGSPDYSLTWEGLLELLEDADCAQVSDDLRNVLGLNTQALQG